MSLENPGALKSERKGSRAEQLEREVQEQEKLLQENEEKLEALLAELEEERDNDPIEIEKRREGVLERLESLKSNINSRLMMFGPGYAMIGAMIFDHPHAAAVERLTHAGSGAAIGLAVAGIAWGLQRVKVAIEKREAEGELALN